MGLGKSCFKFSQLLLKLGDSAVWSWSNWIPSMAVTWVKVVRCRLLAGVGHEAVVGVCPACWGNDDTPLPGDDTLPETDESPEFGSGFNFLNAPSAANNHIYNLLNFRRYRLERQLLAFQLQFWSIHFQNQLIQHTKKPCTIYSWYFGNEYHNLLTLIGWGFC